MESITGLDATKIGVLVAAASNFAVPAYNCTYKLIFSFHRWYCIVSVYTFPQPSLVSGIEIEFRPDAE